MKKIPLSLFILFVHITGFSQDWSEDQLTKANTAADIQFLSADEQEAIMYVNLARLFPQDFVNIELEDVADLDVANPAYTRSLIARLNKALPVSPLYFDQTLYDIAKCFAKESGKKGTVGHTRKNCPKGYAAECCSYGMKAGWDIALQWLIDDGVKGNGHRVICLDESYTKIGLSTYPHKKYGICAVADFGR
ncbi:MAG: CAP domain-containing protein [Ferruginibacter sp.]